MIPWWVTLAVTVLGVLGTLSAALLTQALTNRREFERDQLKWAQERQQRVLDQRTAVLAESLTAITRWFDELCAVNEHMADDTERKGRTNLLTELEDAARSALASVQLLCSDSASTAAHRVAESLGVMSYNLRRAWQDNEPGIDASPHRAEMDQLRSVYRDELAKLATEPVAMPRSSPKGLRPLWQRSAKRA